MFPLFLFYRANLTQDDWPDVLENSTTIPALVFCFVVWCPHCKRAIPEWETFETKHDTDRELLVASINCTASPTLCSESLGVQGYPTFIAVTNGTVHKVQTERNARGFAKLADRLLQVHRNNFFRIITGKPPHFPAVVFKMHPDDTTGLRLANTYALTTTHSTTHLFCLDLNEYRTDRHLVVHVDQDYWAEVQGELTIESIVSLVNEHSHPLLGRWSVTSIKALHRLFAVVFALNNTQLEVFRELAVIHQASFAWGSAVFSDQAAKPLLTFFRLKLSQLPAVIIVNAKKNQFVKLLKVETFNDVDHFLAPFEAGAGEEYLGWEPFNASEVVEKPVEMPVYGRTPAEWDESAGFILVLVPGLLVAAVVLGLYGCCCCCWHCFGRPQAPNTHLKTD
jgi:thiol-disulfide isomerase/thioredoxin